MSNLKDVILNESVADVLTVLAPNGSYPSIDNLYSRYRFDVVANRELFSTYQQLVHEGVLAEDEAGHTIKGPNWKAPQFVTDKKYE